MPIDSELQEEIALAELDNENYVEEYYVDNSNVGSASGKRWSDAMLQVSDAIAAWNTLRVTLPNIYSRAVLYVRGTGTAYTKWTTLPQWCTIEGVGADPRGNGTGIARVGLDAGGSDTAVLNTDGTLGVMRGVSIKNMQFQAGAAGKAWNVTSIFRSRFENVAFMGNNDQNPGVGFSVGKLSGVVMSKCHWGQAATDFTIGLNVTGTHFHNTIIEDCMITGTDAGIQVETACINGYGSVVKQCYIGQGEAACALAINDLSTDGKTNYVGNWLRATKSNVLSVTGEARFIGNLWKNDFASVNVS